MLFQVSASVAGDGFDGALGIGIVSTEAFGVASAGGVPGALTDADWDGWIWHSFFHLHQIAATESEGSNAVGSVARITIDSKAMRIFEDSETLFGDVETVTDGTAVGELWADTRILLKLS